MLSRRELITAGFAGGLTGAPPHAGAETVEQQADRDGQKEIASSIGRVGSTLDRALLSNSLSFGMVGKIRAQMETFFRSAQKFPDFIDIGFDVFMDLYDWHVRNQQQLVVTRGPDGRYWMQFMFTTLIMRSEQDPNYIGIPYDKP